MTETTQEVARRDDPELNRLARLGEWLAAAESGRDDARTKGAAAALRLYYAEALALPPLAALELSVIKGRIVPSAQLLRALADEAGLRVVRVESSDTACTAAVEDVRTGRELGRSTFTIEQARQAGLVKPNGNWQSYPARMLWARASSWAIRDYAPRVALGMILPDEVEEVTGVQYDVDGYADPVPDESIEWPEARPSVPAAPSERGGEPATDEQRARLGSLFAELTELEGMAGIDPTDWEAWLERETLTVSGGVMTRERARAAIVKAEQQSRQLRELIRP